MSAKSNPTNTYTEEAQSPRKIVVDKGALMRLESLPFSQIENQNNGLVD